MKPQDNSEVLSVDLSNLEARSKPFFQSSILSQFSARTCLGAFLLFGLEAPALAGDVTNLGSSDGLHVSRGVEALGKALGFQFDSVPSYGQSGTYNTFLGTVLGQQRRLVEYDTMMTYDRQSDLIQTYVNGVQVNSGNPTPDSKGVFQNQVTFPAINAKLTTLNLPVGPLAVNINAGFAMQGSLISQLTPIIALPAIYTTIDLEVKPKVQALGYLEGSVNLLVLRGGVGGQLNVVDADFDVHSRMAMYWVKPQFTSSGYADFLSGDIYAFADYFAIWQWRWKRFWNSQLGHWDGKCFDFNQQQELAGKCVKS